MDDCCNKKTTELSVLAGKHQTVLKIVLMINLLMFFIESAAGWFSNSTALLADSLDMLGDSFVYGISLYAINKSVKWGAGISMVKGIIMLTFGIGVLIQASIKFRMPQLPVAETMGVVGVLALAANFTCAYLLLRHRNDNINMRSTWLCSRNDVIANVAVLIAALFVNFTGNKYPDLVVGVGISLIVIYSSVTILREARQILAKNRV